MDKEQIRKLFSESAGKAKNMEPESMNDFLILRLTGLTPDEIRELKERNTPKEAIYEGDGCPDEETFYDAWICPNCGAEYDVDDDYDFCPDCGQMILR